MSTAPFVTFFHAGGALNTPLNERRGEVLGEWWWPTPHVPVVGDVVVLEDAKCWRVRTRVWARGPGPSFEMTATLHVEPVEPS